MRHLIRLLMALALCTVYSCSRQRAANDVVVNEADFDFSQFYRVNETDEYIYDAHRKVPSGEPVSLAELDNLFGRPLLCDTVIQTSDWGLYEQETNAAQFMPTELGDTLVMMRRIYGRDGSWLIWIDLEIQANHTLRVLNFLAYDNSQIEI